MHQQRPTTPNNAQKLHDIQVSKGNPKLRKPKRHKMKNKEVFSYKQHTQDSFGQLGGTGPVLGIVVGVYPPVFITLQILQVVIRQIALFDIGYIWSSVQL